MNKIQIRLRYEGDNGGWNVRPVFCSVYVTKGIEEQGIENMTGKPIADYVNGIGLAAGAVEARWNFEGSPQGHYHFMKDGK